MSLEILVGTRFAMVMLLLVGAGLYGSFAIRTIIIKGRVDVSDTLPIGTTLIMAGSGAHQLYWWLVEVLIARGNCKSSHALAHECVSARWLAQMDWITNFAYLAWGGGALVVLCLWLYAITPRALDWRFAVPGAIGVVAGLVWLGYWIARGA